MATKKKAAPKKAAPKKSVSKAAPSKSAPKRASNKKPQDDESALHEFFIDELKDIYWAEKHLVKNLPKMHKAAGAESLKTAIANHLEETKVQVTRLEQIFELLGQKPQAKKCDAMNGLVEEGSSIIEDTDKGTATRDVGIILASQKIEHYEIATYGGLAQLAKTLGLEEIKNILGTTLDEEKNADELLTEVAENDINVQAAEEE
ncbi:MAG: ferritin-like domain-containing protein [Flavitalea sp.]